MARSTPCCGVHYAWVVAVVIFIALLMAGGIRSVPGVVTVALETEYGWSRALISGAVSVNILLYGLVGPFAAAVMEALGIRKSVMAALALLALGTGLTPLMKDAWHLYVLWGVLVGWAAGVVAPTLGKVVANRWFASHTGLVMGVFAASSSTGQVAFAPLLGAIVEAHGWRPAALLMAAVAVAMLPMMWFFMVDKPGDIGSAPYGAVPLDETAAEAADAAVAAEAADATPSMLAVAEADAEAPDAAGSGVQVATVGVAVVTEVDGSGERVGSGGAVVVPVAAELTEAGAGGTITALRIAAPSVRHAVDMQHARGLELVQSGGASVQAAGLASPLQGGSVNPLSAAPQVRLGGDVASQDAAGSSCGAATTVPPAHVLLHACVAPDAASCESADVAITPGAAVPDPRSTLGVLEPPPAAAGAAAAASRWTPFLLPLRRLREAASLPDFWLLAGSFFVCGASTNGLIATHIIPACQDHGMAETAASGFLAGIGVFDIAGTIASGWLTDRCVPPTGERSPCVGVRARDRASRFYYVADRDGLPADCLALASARAKSRVADLLGCMDGMLRSVFATAAVPATAGAGSRLPRTTRELT